MDAQVQEILQKCTVEGMVVKLPAGQLDRAMYVKCHLNFVEKKQVKGVKMYLNQKKQKEECLLHNLRL